MTDPAEIRAEARRLLAEYRRVTESPREYYERLAAGSKWAKWVEHHADVLLADPAPVGLTEDERRTVEYARTHLAPGPQLVAIIDRLSAVPVDDRERVPDEHTVIDGDLYRVRCEDLGDPFGSKAYLFPVSLSVDPEEG